MFVGIVRVELHLPGSSSLKDKRAVLRALKDRLHGRTSIAVAEVDHQDLWQRAALGLAAVSGDHAHLSELLREARSIIESRVDAVVLDWQEQEA
jgi:uncharacterized protein YlxP (DUF503 family)